MAAAGAWGVEVLFEASTAAQGRHPPVAPPGAMERADVVKEGGDVAGSLHPKPERQRGCNQLPPYGLACIPPEETWADVPNVPETVSRYESINKEEQAGFGGCSKKDAVPSTPPHLIRAVLLRTPPSGNESSVGSPPSVVPESKAAQKLKNRPRRRKPFSSALAKLGSPSRSKVSKGSSGVGTEAHPSRGISSDSRRECFMSRLITLAKGCEINTDIVEMFTVAFGKLVVEDNSFHVATPWLWENFAERRQSVEAFRCWFARTSRTLNSISILLLPIHGRGHWSLVSLCMDWHAGDKPMFTALHFDSLEGLHEANLRIDSGACVICTRVLEASGRTNNDLVFYYSKLNVPQQHNKVDCGAYTMFFIRECYAQRHNLQRVTGAEKELVISRCDDISTVSRSYARSLLMMHWDFIDTEVPMASIL